MIKMKLFILYQPPQSGCGSYKGKHPIGGADELEDFLNLIGADRIIQIVPHPAVTDLTMRYTVFYEDSGLNL